MKTSIINADQLWSLLMEAGAAGDLDQVAICTAALQGDDDATAECARVIADTEAMDDDEE